VIGNAVRPDICILIVLATSSPGLSAPPSAQTGETFEILVSYKTSQKGSDGSSGTSSGREAFLERVIARREDGVEVEFDLPLDATADDRARNWQLPARVLKTADGRMQLLNADELEKRLDVWLSAAKWDRSVCGRWIFTWNAFRIECDPQSIISRLEEVDVTRQALSANASYLDPRAADPALVVQVEGTSIEPTFRASARVDPDKIRLERAKADVAVGEILQKPTNLDAALLQRANEKVSGSITVTWNSDEAGVARKRTKTSELEITRPDGTVESQIETEIVERRPVRRSARDES
jgi:hypothetical protein